MPLSVGRPKSVAAIQAALANESKEILVVTQRDSSVEVPGPADLFPIATKAVIKRSSRDGDKYEILVLGVERVALADFTGDDFLRASFHPIPLPDQSAKPNPEIEALHREVIDLATQRPEIRRRRVAGRVRPRHHGQSGSPANGLDARQRAQHGRRARSTNCSPSKPAPKPCA